MNFCKKSLTQNLSLCYRSVTVITSRRITKGVVRLLIGGFAKTVVKSKLYITYFELTEDLLVQFRTIAPELYNEIDVIKDCRGRNVFVYVKFVSETEMQQGAAATTNIACLERDTDLDEVREYVKIAKHRLGVIKQCDSKKWELTLTTEELQFTINLDFYEPNYYKSLSDIQRRYLDIFIFMCLQGTSPIDTKKIKETDIVRGKLIGDRRKTRNGFKVELGSVSEQILIKNNYDLYFIDQTFNEAIKKMFVTIFELYRPYFEDKYDEEYQITYTQRKSKGDEEFLLMLHKGLFTEGMTGRRTFITNLNEESSEIGMRENMKRTGHARIQTHLGYQKDRQTGKNSKRRSLFGVSKINQSQETQQKGKPRLRTKRRQRIILNRIIL